MVARNPRRFTPTPWVRGSVNVFGGNPCTMDILFKGLGVMDSTDGGTERCQGRYWTVGVSGDGRCGGWKYEGVLKGKFLIRRRVRGLTRNGNSVMR